MRNYKTGRFDDGRNTLLHLYETASFFRVVSNFVVIYIARFLPSFELKNALYRLLGVKVGRDVAVGLMAMFDIIFPELITIGDNTVIGYNTTILCHEYLVNEWRKGKVVIGKNVMIGANSTLLPGVTIGDNAVISACSLVNKDVAPNTMVGGVPIRFIKNL